VRERVKCFNFSSSRVILNHGKISIFRVREPRETFESKKIQLEKQEIK